LENLPGFSFLQCVSDTSGHPDCEGDSCDTVEKGVYKAPDSRVVAIAAIVVTVMADALPNFAVQNDLSSSPEIALISIPPRESCESWEYYSSRALAIRGPSLPS
jgi:hypothetical protein